MVVSASASFHSAGLAVAAGFDGAGLAQEMVAVERSNAQPRAAKIDLCFIHAMSSFFGRTASHPANQLADRVG